LAAAPPRSARRRHAARQEDWTLEVFEANRADGSVRYSVELPVKVGG
jgi:hypothetical protein